MSAHGVRIFGGKMAERENRQRATSRWTRAFVIAFASLGVLLLTACGAVIDTALTINDDGSGVRVITATVSADDIAKVTGGADAVEAAITENIPADLAYDGRSAGADGGEAFTFSVPFASQEDYETKVIGILGAGGVIDLNASVTIVVANTAFRQGVEVEENFTSSDLLQWLRTALVARGAVAGSDKSNLSELGTTSVIVQDIGHETSHSISYSDVQDFGVRELTVTTEGAANGKLVRIIEYDLAREAYAHNPDGVDAFFQAATPKGGELTAPLGAESVWTITFKADSPKELMAMTNTALASTSTDFAVSDNGATGEGTTMSTSIIDYIECSTICGADAEVSSILTLPNGWTSNAVGSISDAAESSESWRLPGDHEPITFTHNAPFEKVAVDARVSPTGESSISLSFALDKGHAEAVGEAFTKQITPTSTIGNLDVTERDGAVSYAVTVKGDSPQALNARLVEYLQGISGGDTGLGITPVSSTLVTDSYLINYAIALPPRLLSGGVTEGISYTMELPGGFSVADTSTLPTGTVVDGATVTYTESAPTAVTMTVNATGVRIVSIVIAGVVALLVLAGIAALIWWRRRRTKPVDASAAQAMHADTIFSPPADATELSNAHIDDDNPTLEHAERSDVR